MPQKCVFECCFEYLNHFMRPPLRQLNNGPHSVSLPLSLPISLPLYLCHSRLHFLCHQLFKPKCRPNFVPHRVVLPLATLTHEFRLNNIFGSNCTSLAPCIIYVYLCIISKMLLSLSPSHTHITK